MLPDSFFWFCLFYADVHGYMPLKYRFSAAVKPAIVNRQSVLFSHYARTVPSFKPGYDGTNGATGAQLSMELLTCTHNTGCHKALSYTDHLRSQKKEFSLFLSWDSIFCFFFLRQKNVTGKQK